MDLLYRVMGLAAAIGEGLSRLSVHGIQLNWVLMSALGGCLVVTGNELRCALDNDTEPRRIDVADALLYPDPDHAFVMVHGELVAEPMFTYGQATPRNYTVEASYYALLDQEHERALLVRTRGYLLPGTATGTVDLIGMLVPVEQGLQNELARTKGVLGGVAFATDYVLEWNRRPGDPWLWAGASAALAVALLAMLTTWRNRYVVFRCVDRQFDQVDPLALHREEPLPTFASGVFRHGGHLRRLTNFPALLADDDGTPVLCANVCEASDVMDVETAGHRSVWTITLPGTMLRAIDVGYLYHNLRRRPAVRVHHADGNREATTLMSCDHLGTLRLVAERLASAIAPTATS